MIAYLMWPNQWGLAQPLELIGQMKTEVQLPTHLVPRLLQSVLETIIECCCPDCSTYYNCFRKNLAILIELSVTKIRDDILCSLKLVSTEQGMGRWVMGQMGHENRMGRMGHGSLGVDP